MSEAIKEMITSAAKENYVQFSESLNEHIEAKMKDRLTEEVAEIQAGLFEKRGENKEKANTGDGEGDFEQDGPRDEFNTKPGGDETKSDKGGKKVKNKMKTEQDNDDDDDDMDDDDKMKKEQDDDEEDGDDKKKPNPFAKKNGNGDKKKPNPFAKKNGDDSDDEEDNDDEEDADDKIKDEKKKKK